MPDKQEEFALEIDANDRRVLRQYGADLKCEKFHARYRKYRNHWKAGNQVGGMPTAILFQLAVDHPCPVRFPKPEKKPKKPEPALAN